MPRLLASLLLLAAAASAFLATACDASVTEGCIGGVCDDGAGGNGSSTTATTGSGGAGGSVEPPTTGDFPCDVFAVLQQKCQPCHNDPTKYGAPFPLLTYEDTQAPIGSKGRKRYQRMAEVIAPASGPFMPLMPNMEGVTALSDAELTLLSTWLASPFPAEMGMGCECPGAGCN